MEEFSLVRCDSLDAGSGCDGGAMTPIDHVTFDPAASLEPSPAELAQCEAEVGTLLSIIADLNRKMGSLKAPSEPGGLRPAGPSRPLVPDLLSHRLARSSPERNSASAVASKPPLTGRGGGGVVWTKLQEVLSSVEDSISCKRSWAAPITASDRKKHQEHLRAAQESWSKATQILEDMEREFGISCPSGPSKDQDREDILDLEPCDSDPLRSVLRGHQEETEGSQTAVTLLEEERNKLVRAWRSGSRSPSYRPPAGPLSPDWAPPPFAGSPLLHRRAARAAGEEAPPLGSLLSLEPETERLNRCVERLRARNERLTAALERKKAEFEQLSVSLSRVQADCAALQTALRYSEQSDEAYRELLSLHDSERLQRDSAGSSTRLRNLEEEELSTSFSTAGVSEETQTLRTGAAEREAVLRQKIEQLKKDRAAVAPPRPNPAAEDGTGPKPGPGGGPGTRDGTKKEKGSVFYELLSVREEMSDLRALIRLKEKELRCLEWSLMAQKAPLVPESLLEELEVCRAEQQRLCENAAKLATDGDISRTRPVLKELQAVLQREQALKKRLASVHDSLNAVQSDRRDGGEQVARLTQAHSKALSSYRQIRRKYREQVWRLEQKVAAMTESQQGGAARAGGDASEWRREETVL